jgi:hypothetical protein
VLGWKTVEGQQRIAVFGQASDGLLILRHRGPLRTWLNTWAFHAHGCDQKLGFTGCGRTTSYSPTTTAFST